MEETNTSPAIKETVKSFLTVLGVSFDEVTQKNVSGQELFNIETKNTRALIGENGDTLNAIDYLVKRLIEKKERTYTHFSIDVDGYKEEQIKDIQQKATIMAERAKSFQYDVEMPPMSAYERLIVHATLQNMENIKTESQGTGKERRLVIKFIA